MKLVKKTYIQSDEIVYDIEVEDNHNYCITEKDMIVHNSGKGFVQKNLFGIQGKVFDVDALKKLAIKTVAIAQKVKARYGVDLKTLNLKNPDDVSKLHDIVSDMGLIKGKDSAFNKAVLMAHPDKRPNIIFDVTLKDFQKLDNITRRVQELGYDKKNIHIVWVINDVEIAKQLNAKRSRVVPKEILLNTHKGVSVTISDILKSGTALKKYMDGCIYFVFNKTEEEDSKNKNPDSKINKSKNGGEYIKKANYIKVKEVGKTQMLPDDLSDEIINKIIEYAPDTKTWGK